MNDELTRLNARLVSHTPYAHPQEPPTPKPYRLIQFRDTGVYALIDASGTLRACPQDWANHADN